ncbi:MAG: phosphodiester glycosidase family protein [Verrucomicrobiota bacterium]|nr:phosphodiester glycosidase family protein [Verrucomicrobiota bacterium]
MFLDSARCSRSLGRRVRAALLAFACGIVSAQAQWSVVSTQSDFSSGRNVEHRHVVARSGSGDEATLDLAVFASTKATLRVIDQPGANEDLAAVMQRENAIAGVNGGYFDPEYAPVGLLISDGRMVAPQRKARLLSGIVSVVNGRVQIHRAAEFSGKSKATAARQCGPFLVEGGKAVPGLNDARAARRTFVAVAAGDRAAIGYCSYVSLAQLGSLLAAPAVLGDLKVTRALNLDGGSSSGFWFKGENGPVSIREQKSVRDFLAIVPKS